MTNYDKYFNIFLKKYWYFLSNYGILETEDNKGLSAVGG